MRSTEQQKVLDMLEKGRITPDEAARLLDCLGQSDPQEPGEKGEHIQADAKRMQGKKLRVEVKGDTEEMKKVNVNVSVPLILARYADNIIANCVPDEATKELKAKGIDLRSLNIGAIVDTFETLEEDIVCADIDQEDTQLKVRVYVE